MGSDNSYRFAQFDELASSQIAPVTLSTNAAAAFTGQNRADLELFNTDPLQIVGNLLINKLIRLNDLLLLIDRIDNGFTADAPDNTSGEVHHFFVAFIN